MSKKSRRLRRQQLTKKDGSKKPAISTPVAEVVEEVEAPSDVVQPTVTRKGIGLATEYFYVYRDIRNVFIVALLMFFVLVGLSYVI